METNKENPEFQCILPVHDAEKMFLDFLYTESENRIMKHGGHLNITDTGGPVSCSIGDYSYLPGRVSPLKKFWRYLKKNGVRATFTACLMKLAGRK